MIETVELVCKRIHMPYPNVRIPANTRVAIGPPWLAEALCVRGFFEKVSDEILQKEKDAAIETEAKAAAEASKEPEAPKKAKKGESSS